MERGTGRRRPGPVSGLSRGVAADGEPVPDAGRGDAGLSTRRRPDRATVRLASGSVGRGGPPRPGAAAPAPGDGCPVRDAAGGARPGSGERVVSAPFWMVELAAEFWQLAGDPGPFPRDLPRPVHRAPPPS